ncbi:serine hydrolase [Maribellus sp. CM-23]|uniref:serine hydrolase domain-containing protein n=1 Tax=Maribellus sp. CM-23 TaxID=2781026 RepID=UPI001F47F24C|nr:serine hydrolase [Maribellus sp. CM-23]MCE4563913.1 serine hydrolase [Maribellus sp. CM-23]
MKILSFIIVTLLLANSCHQDTTAIYGFWEGPHPENKNRKFYVRFYENNHTLTAHGFWTHNGFYDSEFEIDSVYFKKAEIRFFVPMWECTYLGKLIGNSIVSGGFSCPGEPFDSVSLIKNDNIHSFLIDALPGSQETGFTYSWKTPPENKDGLKVANALSPGEKAFLDSIIPKIAESKFGRINSILVSKDHQLFCEEYFWGYQAKDLHPVESVTKSVTSLLTGIAIDQGKISGTDEKIADIFPEIRHNQPELFNQITLEHLLSMTSGCESKDDQLTKSEDRLNFCLNRKIIRTPGEVFQYDGGNTEILGAVIHRKTGMFADKFAMKYLFEPLNIQSVKWSDYQQNGYPLMSGALCLRPRDMLKIGELILQKGQFNGRRILSEKWIEESTTAYVETGIEKDQYSYLWWNILIESKHKSYPCIWGNGWGSQFIYVVPELELVIVTTGHNYAQNSWAFTSGLKEYLYLLDESKH